MREMKYLKVSADIARRAGVLETRFKTADGEYIINESDLRMIRLEPEEYATGIPCTILTEQEAAKLIEENSNQIGEGTNDEKNEEDFQNDLSSTEEDGGQVNNLDNQDDRKEEEHD